MGAGGAAEAVAAEPGPEEAHLALKPSAAADGAVVALPGPVKDVRYAGGGRFLLLRMPSVRQVAVLDVVLGKVVELVPLPEEGAFVAGGLHKFYVFAPSAHTIHRWDLQTMTEEAALKNPLAPQEVKRAATGHGVDGPLFLTAATERYANFGWAVVDPRTMQKLDVDLRKSYHELSELAVDKFAAVHASADGNVFAWSQSMVSPSGVNTLVLEKTGGRTHHLHESRGVPMPGPTGDVYAGPDVYSSALHPVGGMYRKADHRDLPLIPAVEGPWHVALERPSEPTTPWKRDVPMPPVALKASIRLKGENRLQIPLAPLEGVARWTERYFSIEHGPLGLQDRIHLFPTAQVLALLPMTNDRVVLRRVDVQKGLDAAVEDYLMVVSRPPAAAIRGTPFRYTLKVWSKKKDVTLQVDDGPPGMRIVDGTVAWDVPADFAEKEWKVMILVSAAGGQEVLHAVPLTIQDPPAPAPQDGAPRP